MTTTEVAPRLTYREMRSRAQEIADEQLKERVLKGIAILNQEYGPDWVDHVDLDKLVLSSTTCCVLGQVYGGESCVGSGYSRGKAALGIREGTEYAFDRDYVEGETYTALDDAWKKVLA